MRLIVVDDDRLVVDSLKIILGAQPQIEVVGTGANGNDAVALYAEHSPDIALLDILVAAYIAQSGKIRAGAAWLFVPYLCWILFATYLNAGILAANGTGL